MVFRSTMHHILQPTDKLTNKRTSRSVLSQELTVAFPSFYILATMALGAVLVERGETQFTNIFTVVMGVFMCAQFVGIRIVYTPSVVAGAAFRQQHSRHHQDLPSEDDAARAIKRRVTTATSPSPTFPSRIPRVPTSPFSRTSPSPSLSASRLLSWVPVAVASPPSSPSSNASIVPTLAPFHSVVISSNH